MKDLKVYVNVIASFNPDGKLIPRSLTWEDGHEYLIDRILDVRPAASLKAGGQGDRYTVQILGKNSYLFFERNPNFEDKNIGRWFVERKQPN